MTFGSHILAGVVFASFFNLPVLPSVLGSILPDVDLKKGLPFPNQRTLFNSHRGITHHILIPIVLLFVSITVKDFLNKSLGLNLLSFTVGYFSHLFLDALTPLGIPYSTKYYPRFSFKLFKTGKIGELFVILILIALLIFQIKSGELDYSSFKFTR
jgi:inner membrane protein